MDKQVHPPPPQRYVSPYFVTDPERMVSEYDGCRLLLVDKKISTAR